MARSTDRVDVLGRAYLLAAAGFVLSWLMAGSEPLALFPVVRATAWASALVTAFRLSARGRIALAVLAVIDGVLIAASLGGPTTLEPGQPVTTQIILAAVERGIVVPLSLSVLFASWYATRAQSRSGE